MSERATLNKLELLRDKLCCLIESSSTSNTLLQELINSIVLTAAHNIDFEMALVQDENGDIFQMVFEKDEDTGVVTTTYVDADGNPATPTGAVAFVNPSALLAQIDVVLDTIKLDTAQIVLNTAVPAAVTNYVTVSATIVNAWNAATSFVSDVISFVGRDKNLPWSFHIAEYAIVSGLPTLTVEASIDGINFDPYTTLTDSMDMTDRPETSFTFDSIAPFEYLRFRYANGGAVGTFSLLINK